MKRGQRINVRLFGGKIVERIVWKDVGRGVLLCTAESFEEAERTGTEPVTVGFSKETLIVG